MGENIFDICYLSLIINADNQSIIITFDIEYSEVADRLSFWEYLLNFN
jgi:hypothetical protein